MSVSVRMPQLGESVTEGTVTRWLKKEGDVVKTDEPLLEVSTDKVDTEIPSPASGVLRGIAVGEEETVEVGAELAVIEEEGATQQTQPAAPPRPAEEPAHPARAEAPPQAPLPQPPPRQAPPAEEQPARAPAADRPPAQQPPGQAPAAEARPAPGTGEGEGAAGPPAHLAESVPPRAPWADWGQAAPAPQPAAADSASSGAAPPAPAAAAEAPQPQQYPPPTSLPGESDGPYITPLVRKLAAEHGVDLASIQGTGVGGRIRKQDVLDASRAMRTAPQRQPAAPQPAPAPRSEPAHAPAAPSPAAEPAQAASPAAQPAPTAPSPRAPAAASPIQPDLQPSPLRGTAERMSRLRQLIAQRMVDSLHTSAQLTTVAETDVTKIARLRDRAKADFETREGVRLSFLPFFALATVEALKSHPKLNAVIDTEQKQVTYHDVEHLGIAVDTDRGLLVPVVRNAGDLNIGGLARKIDDLARRTRSGQVSPDELSGGTFTLTNTGSRGVLFDTPIINQPQVAILGTGSVVKRPVVVDDPALGEVIAVRSVVYLSLTYDHRLVDGADAARFLAAMKNRLEEGAFEAELGL